MRPTSIMLPAVTGLLIPLATQLARGDDAARVTESIDRHVMLRLDSEGLRHVAAADDAEFLRRVVLDLHGVVPSAERTARFLDSTAPDKRDELIEELLASPRFGEHLSDVWRRYLISPLANEQRMQPDRFAGWLAERFSAHQGWDAIVRELLTATGTIDENPGVTYLIEGRHPLGVADLTDLTSRYFLGIRLNCAQCHNHPFAAWTREDYWGMAAFFVQIQTPARPKMVHIAGVQDNPRMTLASLADGDVIDGFLLRPPTFLGGEELPGVDEPTHRRALARWITSPENPYFARASVNRTWWHLFGRGFVNPVDDMHGGNPASHPELLDALSRQFAESGFDLQFLYRAIVSSRTYQRTSRPGEEPDREAALFARMSIKVLSAEQLFDSLVEVLGPPARAPGIDVRLGARHEFSQFFADDGDPDPTRYARGIPHVLRLMNSPQFAGRSLDALVTRIASPGRPAEEVVQELFLRILARRPVDAERDVVREHLDHLQGTPERVYRDVAWALLTSSEFSLNH
jgi:hypothetical protein